MLVVIDQQIRTLASLSNPEKVSKARIIDSERSGENVLVIWLVVDGLNI